MSFTLRHLCSDTWVLGPLSQIRPTRILQQVFLHFPADSLISNFSQATNEGLHYLGVRIEFFL